MKRPSLALAAAFVLAVKVCATDAISCTQLVMSSCMFSMCAVVRKGRSIVLPSPTATPRVCSISSPMFFFVNAPDCPSSTSSSPSSSLFTSVIDVTKFSRRTFAVDVIRVHETRLFVTVCPASACASSAAAAAVAAPTSADEEGSRPDIPVVRWQHFSANCRVVAAIFGVRARTKATHLFF